MEEGKASRTALGTALMRALHSRSDTLPLLADTWGEELVPQSVKDEFFEYAVRAFQSSSEEVDSRNDVLARWLKRNPSYATVITRSRYTEDALVRAIGMGIEQYVLIGAGFDSFILRRGQAHAGLRIFEIDHPSTQILKRRRISQCGLSLGAGVSFLPADLSRERLDQVLDVSSFDKEAKTFFSWLGVSMYLSREANRHSLETIASCSAVGSQLVFTYFDERVFGNAGSAESARFIELQKIVSALGEPFLSGFSPDRLREDLRDVGFELLEDMSDQDVVARYDPENANGFAPLPFSRIAHACVV